MTSTPQWEDIIHLSTVNIIVGYKGRGKSGLGYYLLEKIALKHKLKLIVVNFPREKQALLPKNYIIADLSEALTTENAMILVDEGTTQLPAGSNLEEFIKGCSSLSRQKDQIIIFIFHASRDIGSRILRGIDVLMIKEPSRRQIEQGSKDKYFRELLVKAKQKIRAQEGERRSFTYVDSEEPEYSGLMENTLPSFWSDDLSKAWRGVAIERPERTANLAFDLLDTSADSLSSEVARLVCYVCPSCKRFAYMVNNTCEYCGTTFELSQLGQTYK